MLSAIDAAHKLSLLAANAFGAAVMFDEVATEGITDVRSADMRDASRKGF